MIRNIYTLEHIAREIESYAGYTVSDCFTQEKAGASIELSNPENTVHLQFSADSGNDAIYIRLNFARSRKNSADILPELKDEILQGASLLPGNRIIKLTFINTVAYCILFGGKNSNLLICSGADGRIIDAFLDAKNHIGNIFKKQSNPVKDLEDFSPDTAMRKALGSCRYMLGSIYAEEILHRLGFDSKRKLGDVSGKELSEIKKESMNFIERLKTTRQYYTYIENDKAVFSLEELTSLGEPERTFASVSQGVKYTASRNRKTDDFLPLYKQLSKKLEKDKRKLKSKIDGFDVSKTEDRIEKYKYFGDLLASTPNPNQTPGKTIKLIGFEGEPIEIKLDGKITLIENSGRYYEKAKKAREELKVRKARLPEIKKKLAEVEAALAALENCESLKDLEKLNIALGKKSGIKIKGKEMNREDKFRKFELEDGFMLYVGKNAANNDELTVKFAKPNDIWLHARGSSGSHAVIRVEKGQKVPKRIIEQAAAICAYYSGQKNSKYAPVAYTEKKYVRKPKGAAVGAVTIAREKVVMVEPKQNLD